MSQRCVLTIYEPEKEPRVVELQVNQFQSNENDISVYNEDGTVLEDYELYVEGPDNRLIKAPPTKDVSKKKWNAFKFWKKWKSKIGFNGTSNSVISDVPLSEDVHQFLKTYEINSKKKENKIARLKKFKQLNDERKLRNKLKRQKKKERRRQLSNVNSDLPFSSARTEKDFSINDKKNIQKKIEWKHDDGGGSHNECMLKKKQLKKRERRARKQEKKKILAIQNQKYQKLETENDKLLGEQVLPSSATVVHTSNHRLNLNVEKSSTRWKASEPAADFIPVNRADQEIQDNGSADFLSFNTSKSNYRYSNYPSNSENSSHPQSFKNKSDYIGLSQKAFFLQC